jgi:hypothetical protein
MAGLDPAIHAFLETTRIWRQVMKKTGWSNTTHPKEPAGPDQNRARRNRQLLSATTSRGAATAGFGATCNAGATPGRATAAGATVSVVPGRVAAWSQPLPEAVTCALPPFAGYTTRSVHVLLPSEIVVTITPATFPFTGGICRSAAGTTPPAPCAANAACCAAAIIASACASSAAGSGIAIIGIGIIGIGAPAPAGTITTVNPGGTATSSAGGALCARAKPTPAKTATALTPKTPEILIAPSPSLVATAIILLK